MSCLQSQIGVRVHTLVGALAEERAPVSGPVLLSAAGQLLRAQPMTSGNRAGRQRIASMAALYLRTFAPPADWQFLGAEHPVADGRVDIAWQATDGTVLFDEIKTITRLLTDDVAREQVDRYLASGTAMYGPRFAGVRLLALAEPQTSLFAFPDGRRISLQGSSWWLGGQL
jgi:hypothetical protein